MKTVRISAKAIIITNGRLLVIRNRDTEGDWYMLPGGGQEYGETLPAALNRECLEEIGASVTVGRLRFIRDYIAEHHEFAAEGEGHQVELMFECNLMSAPRLGEKPDAMQTGIDWIDLGALPQHRLYPKVLKGLLTNGIADAVSTTL
jgi:8-oxo-dGTP pyrophosphatase MutT (NUDIX family)